MKHGAMYYSLLWNCHVAQSEEVRVMISHYYAAASSSAYLYSYLLSKNNMYKYSYLLLLHN